MKQLIQGLGLLVLLFLISCGAEYLRERTGSTALAKKKDKHEEEHTPEPTPSPEPFVPSENSDEIREYNPRPNTYCYQRIGYGDHLSCVYTGENNAD